MPTRHPVTDEQKTQADLYDTTFDTLLAEGATIPEAHTLAISAVVERATNRVQDALDPTTRHERMTA